MGQGPDEREELSYRTLKGWKYELLAPYGQPLPVALAEPRRFLASPYLTLAPTSLVIQAHYAWDGASGPTFDTKSSIRASLVHDALYQCIRLGWLERGLKPEVDKLFRELCRADGMGKFRAWYWWKAVTWFGLR